MTNPIRFGAVARLLRMCEAHTCVEPRPAVSGVEAREACRAKAEYGKLRQGGIGWLGTARKEAQTREEGRARQGSRPGGKSEPAW